MKRMPRSLFYDEYEEAEYLRLSGDSETLLMYIRKTRAKPVSDDVRENVVTIGGK